MQVVGQMFRMKWYNAVGFMLCLGAIFKKAYLMICT